MRYSRRAGPSRLLVVSWVIPSGCEFLDGGQNVPASAEGLEHDAVPLLVNDNSVKSVDHLIVYRLDHDCIGGSIHLLDDEDLTHAVCVEGCGIWKVDRALRGVRINFDGAIKCGNGVVTSLGSWIVREDPGRTACA